MQGTLIAHWMYLTGIGLAVAMRYLAPGLQTHGTSPQVLKMLLPILALVALADYAASLFVERSMRKRGLPAQATAIPIVTAAFGVSIPIYGIVAWLLGASTGWFWFFVALAALHWFRSAARWQNWQSGSDASSR
jgi:hypothetical protein